ncbi:hypothetical protein [Nonomuraea sp. NPDC049129]|uniref:hypothetical protein n=1 Tax=Nonomuraea sp. NPDC049129 TaxID=3155272 RepID=UPI0033CB0D2C
MRDGQYRSRLLIDDTTASLQHVPEMESAALRAAVASCQSDKKEPGAGFSNSI